MRILAIAVAFVLLPQVAEAAKKKKPAEAPAPVVAPKEEPAPAPAPVVEPHHEDPPYEQWGVHGGATLGGEAGLRAEVFGGNHTFGDGYGYGGVDAMYYVGGTGKNVDLGFGLRFGAKPIALAPQAELRWRVAQTSFFHFALYLGVSVPLTFAGMLGGFTYAFQAEPGVLFSFFVRDNMEIFINIKVPGTLLMSGLTIPVPQIGFSASAGFVYTFKGPNIGIFASPEITPGFFAPFGAPTVVTKVSDTRVVAGFVVAYNFRLGVQVRF